MRKLLFIIVLAIASIGCERANINKVEGHWTRTDGDERFVIFSTKKSGSCSGGQYEVHIGDYEYITEMTLNKDKSTFLSLTAINESVTDQFCETSELSIEEEFIEREGIFRIGNRYFNLSDDESEIGVDYFYEVSDNVLILTNSKSGHKAKFER